MSTYKVTLKVEYQTAYGTWGDFEFSTGVVAEDTTTAAAKAAYELATCNQEKKYTLESAVVEWVGY